jgi:hypothetical protein
LGQSAYVLDDVQANGTENDDQDMMSRLDTVKQI